MGNYMPKGGGHSHVGLVLLCLHLPVVNVHFAEPSMGSHLVSHRVYLALSLQ